MVKPFDYVKDIESKKQYLMNDEYAEREYVPWVINRALSLHLDCIFVVNQLNTMSHLDHKLQHDYLFNKIRSKKRFEKWPWKKGIGDDITLIMQTYKYSREKAKQALRVITPEQLALLRQKQQKAAEGGPIDNDRDTS